MIFSKSFLILIISEAYLKNAFFVSMIFMANSGISFDFFMINASTLQPLFSGRYHIDSPYSTTIQKKNHASFICHCWLYSTLKIKFQCNINLISFNKKLRKVLNVQNYDLYIKNLIFFFDTLKSIKWSSRFQKF